MISVYIFCHKKEEADMIYSVCSYRLAVLSNGKMIASIHCDALSYANNNPENITGVDIILYEVRNNRDLAQLKKLRCRFAKAEILVITTPEVPSEYYVIPEVRPIMLLLRPWNKEKAEKVIHRFFSYYFQQRQKGDESGRLMVCTKGEKRYFDYNMIEYMEAREKKIILYSNYEKVDFYSSLTKLLPLLPDCFIRCHRSFIVNMIFVEKIDFSEWLLYLKNTIVIPISKKYGRNLEKLLQKEYYNSNKI